MVNINEKIKQGFIQFRAIIEVVGKPKNHVEKALKNYLKHIKEKTSLEFIQQETHAPKEVENQNQKLWSTFAEVEVMAQDLQTLVGFCFDYMPSSIEVIAPEDFNIKSGQLTKIFNDLQGKLHNLDMTIKKTKNKNKFLHKNIFSIATNLIAVLLKSGAKSLEDISRYSGMSKQNLKDFLGKLIKEGKIEKKEDSYRWVGKK